MISLMPRRKEGRQGITWFGNLGSFFSFEKIEELIEYELWCPRKDISRSDESYLLLSFKGFREVRWNSPRDTPKPSLNLIE